LNININDTISEEEFKLKVNELENESQKIQSDILSEAISKFSETMKDYELKITKIEKFVENIVEKINKKLEDEDNISGEIQSDTKLNNTKYKNEYNEEDKTVISGGRKNKSKKQRKTRSKKQRKNKSKTKKSKK
jgi:adenylosuccinate synthase